MTKKELEKVNFVGISNAQVKKFPYTNRVIYNGVNTDNFNFMDFNIRNYVLAKLKSLVTINQNSAHSTKTLPDFFSEVREVTKQDLLFLTTPSNPLFLGNLRSGSKILDLPIFIDGEKLVFECRDDLYEKELLDLYISVSQKRHPEVTAQEGLNNIKCLIGF